MPKSRGKGIQNRHENGLAAPGKRIGKQRSNGNLRPQPNGGSPPPSSSLHSSPPVTQPTALPQTVDISNGTATASTMGLAANTHDVVGSSGSPGFPVLTGADAEAFEAGLLGGIHSQARTDESGGKVSAASMDSLTLVATILKSCPLRDVIAILIILLQLPPTFLTIVNALYTLLTFVPPTPGIVPPLHEMILGGTGAPSLATIMAVDVVIFLVWLGLWEPAQNYVLDLSQAVIAVSLGGAAAGKNGTTNGFLVCASIILASHLNRHKQVRYYSYHILWATLSRVSSGRIQSPSQPDAGLDVGWTSRSWINRVFAVHIFSQGVLRWVRRSLMSRDIPTKLPSNGADPEVGLSPQPQRSNSIGADSNPDTSSCASSDGRPPGQPPASSTGKEKDSNSKKKRKQANLVRRLQPLWAALASTKVTVMKEMEQAQPSPDAIEADATDVSHIGNANSRETRRIWISELLPTEIRFQGATTSSASHHGNSATHLSQDSSTDGDKTRPFYVRLNGADWSSTRIYPTYASGDSLGENLDYWAGEIYGLTPLSSYYCEFIRCSDDVLVSAINITSPPAPTAEQASAPTSAHQSLRPSSPATTLKNSIVAAEANLSELRNKLKKVRKEHKSSITALRKELDSLNIRSESAGNTDDRQRQRILQMRQNIQQANNASAEMSEETDSLATVPKEELQRYAAKKAEWEESQSRHRTAQESLDEANKKANQEQSQIRNDILAVTQKRDRLKSRLDKLNEQYDRLSSANANGQSARAQRDSLRARAAIEREMKEGQVVSQIEGMDREREQVVQKTVAIQQKIQLHQSFYGDPRTSTPTTPEGVIPNSRSFVPHASTFPFGPLPTMKSSPGSAHRDMRGGRARSSSMLSDISGLTDHQDERLAEGGDEYLIGANGFDPMSPPRPNSFGGGSLKALSPAGSVLPLPPPSL